MAIPDEFETARLLGARLREQNSLQPFSSMPALLRPQTQDPRNFQGVWVLRRKDSGQSIGRIGLRPVFVNSRDETEVFYTLEQEHWNLGLATEGVRALIELALSEGGMAEVVAITRDNNMPSIRVLEKSGFLFERDVVHDLVPQIVYRRVARSARSAAE